MTRINADNLFGYTKFIVDPSASQGSFTTIQSAINAASAAGGFQIVAIKSGTYVESLTLAMNVQLYGIAVDGRVPTIQITGNHTFTGDGIGAFGTSGILIKNIDFQAPAGNLFTISNTGPNGVIFLVKDCNLSTGTGSGFILSTAGGGSRVICNVTGCNASFQTTGTVCGDSCAFQLQSTSFSANTLAGILLSGNNSHTSITDSSDVSADSDGIIFNNATSTATIDNSSISCNLGPALNLSIGGASVDITHSTFSANGPFWASGPGAGPPCQMNYADIILLGVSAMDVNINTVVRNWQPYCSAGDSLTAIRGTASFDQTAFASTGGFVTSLSQVITSDFSVPLDQTLLNATVDFFTVPVGKTFYPLLLLSEVFSLNTFTVGGTIQAGTNTTYDDLFFNQSISNPPGAGQLTYFDASIFQTVGGTPIVAYPAGSTIGVKITSAATATIYTARFFIQGILK